MNTAEMIADAETVKALESEQSAEASAELRQAG